MFVQVFRAEVEDAAVARRWLEQRAERWQGSPGFLGATGGLSPIGELVLISRFESEEAARRADDRLEGGDRSEELPRGLRGAMTTSESTQVDVAMGGGSNDAGFVQVFWGRGQRDQARAVMTEAEPVLRRERPDILGGFTIWFDDDRFLDVAYFSSEAEAREGEAKALSADGRAIFEQFGRYLAPEGYLDVPDPILLSP